jgi:hypothetical protein
LLHVLIVRGGLYGILGTLSSDEDAEAWIRTHVQPTDEIELVRARPWGTVVRVPVAGGVAWFKACSPVQEFEPRLTATLSSRWPDRLPSVLAHNEERAWLLLGDAGEQLGIGGDPAPWLGLLPRYAELQRDEATHTEEHLAGGVPDRRLVKFPALYQTMLARASSLSGPELARLRAFTQRFGEVCAELAARGIPETIQHDDLHGHNVFRCDEELRILDWGDSCISHPFFSLAVTLDGVIAWGVDDIERSEPTEPFRDAYLEPFGAYESGDLVALAQTARRLGWLCRALNSRLSQPSDESTSLRLRMFLDGHA